MTSILKNGTVVTYKGSVLESCVGKSFLIMSSEVIDGQLYYLLKAEMIRIARVLPSDIEIISPPLWTVISHSYNSRSAFLSRRYDFFPNEESAEIFYNEIQSRGEAGCKRPFYAPSDTLMMNPVDARNCGLVE